MGLFDYVTCEGEGFRCSEGHDLSAEEFQTKDLGCTMGRWVIADRLSGKGGGWGTEPRRPFLGRLSVYAECRECPCFLQARTLNLCGVSVEFEVEVVDDLVRKVTRISQSTAAFLETEPRQTWMQGCSGPMSRRDADAIRGAR